MSYRLLVLVIVILLLVTASSQAFDGQRKGFVMGSGLGFGITRISSETLGLSQSTSRVAPGFGGHIGYAPDNRTVILILPPRSVLTYMDLIADKYDSYFEAMDEGGLKGVAAVIVAPVVLPFLWLGGAHTTLGMIGVRYYFKDQAPSYFVEGVVGPAIIPNEFQEETDGGFGFSLSGGYEFKPHYSVRCDLMIGVSEEEFFEKSSAYSILITINGMVY